MAKAVWLSAKPFFFTVSMNWIAFLKKSLQDENSEITAMFKIVIEAKFGSLDSFQEKLQSDSEGTVLALNNLLPFNNMAVLEDRFLSADINIDSLLTLSKALMDNANPSLLNQNNINVLREIKRKQEALDFDKFLFEMDSVIRFYIKDLRELLGLDQRTFAKWMKKTYKDKYVKVRKISFSEYIDFLKRIMLSNQELNFGDVNPEELLQRIKYGLFISKSTLAEMADSDLKVMRKILKEYPSYSNDKITYGVAIGLLNRLDGYLFKEN